MTNLEELKNIKINNFKGYISQLETVKSKSEKCKLALLEYKIDSIDIKSKQKWLSKHLELGLLFEEIFWFSDFFNDDNAVNNYDLTLLDESVYGFKITVPRIYFEDAINFKILFQNLFFEKKILINELDEYKKCFLSNEDGIPF